MIGERTDCLFFVSVVFFDELLHDPLPARDVVERLDSTYNLSAVRNAEIRLRWQVFAVSRCLQARSGLTSSLVNLL